MKKIVLSIFITSFLISASYAQSINSDTKTNVKSSKKTKDNVAIKKDWSKINLSNRTADHFVIQYGAANWASKPDSIRTGGFSRHFNFYVMLDKPLKNNPKLSVGIGAGIGSSNMFFDKQYADIKSNSTKMPFSNRGLPGTDSANFKKHKLTTIYLELPVELRYYSDPLNPNKSWKLGVGVKVGTLLKSYTKGKDLQTKTGSSIYGPTYIAKESNKRFINGTKVAVTGRIGYGIFSLQGEYNILGVFKEGLGPQVNNYQIGISIGGL